MQLNTLKRQTPLKHARRVGRGGKRGKTSGRGMKGQKARAGHRLRPEFRDVLKKIPKLRGHGKNRSRSVNSARSKSHPVNLEKLAHTFSSGETVTPEALCARGLVRRQRGVLPPVKLLATGTLEHSINVSGCAVSKGAQEKIERAGGTIDV